MDNLKRREEQVLRQNLLTDEQVIDQLVGRYDQALVLTDRKLLIIKGGLMAGVTFGAKATSFDYRTITVEVRTGMLQGVLEIASGGISGAERSAWNTGANGAVKAPNCVPFYSRDGAKFQQAAALIREHAAVLHAPATPTPPVDPTAQLERLAALRQSGMLTEAEFEAEKARILGR
jgi:hypothetical protein